MSKFIRFPDEATKILENSSKYKEYTHKMKLMTSKEEFVKKIFLHDCISFMETLTGEKLNYSTITINWDLKEWQRVCKEKPFVRETYGAVQEINNTAILIVRPETAERWIESWCPQIYFFIFIVHELVHLIYKEKIEKETIEFTYLVAMEKFWEIEFSKEIKLEILQEIEKILT